MEELQEQGLLTTDYRGEPLEDGLQRYTEASATAEQLAEALHETDFPLDHPAHGEAPGERGPASAYYYLALLAAGLQQQGIAYPLEAYRIYRFLTAARARRARLRPCSRTREWGSRAMLTSGV